MGIPVYFKTLVSHYQDTILCKSKINNIHSLFLDLNTIPEAIVSQLVGELSVKILFTFLGIIYLLQYLPRPNIRSLDGLILIVLFIKLK